jgi:hypothetical protein
VFNNGETPEGREFRLGGRIGGGWWSSLPKAIRRQAGAVKLNNENVVELDFSCFNPRVLYALSGVQVPEGSDLYDVGLPAQCRAAVKIVFNAMIFRGKKNRPMSAWPSEIDATVIEPCEAAGVGIKAIQAAIRKRHQPIAQYFDSAERIGFKLLNIESNIMIQVLTELGAKGIVALPYHDAVMVPSSASGTARGIMEKVYAQHVNGAAQLVIKRTACDLPRVEAGTVKAA